MKTDEEVEQLKASWVSDPCWDIETTEGFEDHREELAQYCMEQEELWRMEDDENVRLKAIELGIEDKPALAKYILGLESRLKAKDEELDKKLTKIWSAISER